MSVPEILNYIFDMLAFISQFTLDDQCQHDNPQEGAQKKTQLKFVGLLFY